MSKGKKIVIWSIGVLFTIVVTSIVGEYFYLNNTKITKIDEDILIESEVISKCLQV